MKHPDPDGCHDRDLGMTRTELDGFRPRCTVIKEFTVGQRILLGGHWAADYESLLQFHGVHAKCCLAGTASGHRIINYSPHFQW